MDADCEARPRCEDLPSRGTHGRGAADATADLKTESPRRLTPTRRRRLPRRRPTIGRGGGGVADSAQQPCADAELRQPATRPRRAVAARRRRPPRPRPRRCPAGAGPGEPGRGHGVGRAVSGAVHAVIGGSRKGRGQGCAPPSPASGEEAPLLRPASGRAGIASPPRLPSMAPARGWRWGLRRSCRKAPRRRGRRRRISRPPISSRRTRPPLEPHERRQCRPFQRRRGARGWRSRRREDPAAACSRCAARRRPHRDRAARHGGR